MCVYVGIRIGSLISRKAGYKSNKINKPINQGKFECLDNWLIYCIYALHKATKLDALAVA